VRRPDKPTPTGISGPGEAGVQAPPPGVPTREQVAEMMRHDDEIDTVLLPGEKLENRLRSATGREPMDACLSNPMN